MEPGGSLRHFSYRNPLVERRRPFILFWKPRTTDFEKAVRPELPVLYRVSRRLGASPDDAEDYVQLTLLRAYEHWKSFDGRFLRSWLIRI